MEGGDLWNYLKRQPASRPPADSGTSSPSASGAAGLLAGGGLAAAPVSSMGGHPAMALSEDDARSVFQQVSSISQLDQPQDDRYFNGISLYLFCSDRFWNSICSQPAYLSPRFKVGKHPFKIKES
jgi:hypothetical protein